MISTAMTHSFRNFSPQEQPLDFYCQYSIFVVKNGAKWQKSGIKWNLSRSERYMFRGINHISLDTKGRLAMPTRYRERLELDCHGQLIATIDPETTCLLIYPFPEWEIIEQKIQALSSFNRVTRRLQRLLIGHATELEIDNQGRILLPQSLRDYAKLSRNIVLVGQGKKFELWDERSWQEHRELWLAEESAKGDELPEQLQDLAL